MSSLLKLCGFHKRSGIPVNEVMYCLTLWGGLKENSVSMFARESLPTFCSGGKDILYEGMNREDWNWRGLNFNIGRKAQRLHAPFKDGRSIVAKRYRSTYDQTKPQMASPKTK